MKELKILCADKENNSLEVGNEIYYADHKSNLVRSTVLGLLPNNEIIIEYDGSKDYKIINAEKVISIDHLAKSSNVTKDEDTEED